MALEGTSRNTIPAQNFLSSSSFMDTFTILSSLETGSSLSRFTHLKYRQTQIRSCDLCTPTTASFPACLDTDLHEVGDAHDGLIGLVEHIPPGEVAAWWLLVICLLGQEAGDVLYGPVRVSKLSAEDSGSDVVL